MKWLKVQVPYEPDVWTANGDYGYVDVTDYTSGKTGQFLAQVFLEGKEYAARWFTSQPAATEWAHNYWHLLVAPASVRRGVR